MSKDTTFCNLVGYFIMLRLLLLKQSPVIPIKLGFIPSSFFGIDICQMLAAKSIVER